MAAEDSAVTCVRCRKTCGGEDMWDVPRQLARKIKELAESNQKIATEMKALANKVEQMEKQRRIDDRWEENEPLPVPGLPWRFQISLPSCCKKVLWVFRTR